MDRSGYLRQLSLLAIAIVIVRDVLLGCHECAGVSFMLEALIVPPVVLTQWLLSEASSAVLLLPGEGAKDWCEQD